jgi:3-phosphoshikimate 1-carboxyvinyltransferase
MANYKVKKSTLSGTITVPPSKSHTHRAILFAMMASGTSTINGYLNSPDIKGMIAAARQLGAKIQVDADKLTITGTGGSLGSASGIIDAGNSGIVLRFVGALAALGGNPTEITGDHSIQSKRPIKPLLDALNSLGATAISLKENDFAPISVQGPLQSGEVTIDGADSQFVSSLLIACSFANGPFTIHVNDPGEKPWIDLTLGWLTEMGLPYTNSNYETYTIPGFATIKPFTKTIPGDFSSAAFPLCAALVTGSPLTIKNIDMTDTQGDKKIIDALRLMGATIEERGRSLIIKKGAQLQGARLDINDYIDAITILAVVACYASGTTEIINAKIARTKECDRISAIKTELMKMGATIEERPDGLRITKSTLHGATLSTYHDHRMVMSLTVAALGASSPSTIEETEPVSKTYPTFAGDFQKIGAQIKVVK